MKTYKIDPTHSSVSFKIRHLLISNVNGSFHDFEGSLQRPNEDFTGSDVIFSVHAGSVYTGNEQRDAHLKGPDFFSADEFPLIRFASTHVEKKSVSEYILTGDLTIKEVTKKVDIDLEYNGETEDGHGQTKIGFDGETKLNRKEFGLNWSMVTETGKVVVGDDVKLQFEMQLVQQ